MIQATKENSAKKVTSKDFFHQQSVLVKMLMEIIGLKDMATQNHSIKVAKYAALIAKEMNLSKHIVDIVKFSGYVHDFGKLVIPEAILSKPSPLSENEFQLIKKHPEKGAELLKSIPSFSCLIPAVLYHHERFDGKGYPGVHKGASIPLIARIISVADAFDAMTNYRSYRKQLSIDEALKELEDNANKQFDPQIVNTFKTLVEKELIELN